MHTWNTEGYEEATAPRTEGLRVLTHSPCRKDAGWSGGGIVPCPGLGVVSAADGGVLSSGRSQSSLGEGPRGRWACAEPPTLPPRCCVPGLSVHVLGVHPSPQLCSHQYPPETIACRGGRARGSTQGSPPFPQTPQSCPSKTSVPHPGVTVYPHLLPSLLPHHVDDKCPA